MRACLRNNIILTRAPVHGRPAALVYIYIYPNPTLPPSGPGVNSSLKDMADLREAEITKLSTQSQEASVAKSLNAPQLDAGTTSTTPNGAARSEKVQNAAASAEPVYIDLLLLGKRYISSS